MRDLILTLLWIVLWLVVLIVVFSALISYGVHVIRGMRESNHIWCNYNELMVYLNIICEFSSIRAALIDPTAPLGRSYLTYQEHVFGTTRIVRVALGEWLVWINECFVILDPISWVRYNIWFVKRVTDSKRYLGL